MQLEGSWTMEANGTPRKGGNIAKMVYTMSILLFFEKIFAYSVTIVSKCVQLEIFRIAGIK